MDHIILGLLLLQSRTIYQLRERVGKGMDLMYSSSMGSIQAAVKKLLNTGDICFTEIVEKGRHKKIYSITDRGKACFFQWINSPFESLGTRNPELVKVYFMGFSDKTSRRMNIENYLSQLTEKYHILQSICHEWESMSVTEENRDIIFYQLAAARYGRDFMKFNIEWYKKLIKEMEGENQ